MAVTLDATLLAQQDEISRKPIIKLTAGKLVAEFPFNGTALANTDSFDQGASCATVLPSGALAVFYRGAEDHELRLMTTDSDVTQWNEFVTVVDHPFDEIQYIDAVVMDSAGNMGVVVQLDTNDLALYIVTPTGTVSNTTTLSSIGPLSGATVCETATGYALLYFSTSSGSTAAYLRTSTDFDTWTAATTLTIPALDNTKTWQDPRLRRLENGNYFLVFAYETLRTDTSNLFNLRYSISTDLSTWGTPVAITSNTDISIDYTSPSIGQTSTGQIYLATEKNLSYLNITGSAPEWESTDAIGTANVWVDDTNGYLYLTHYNGYTGIKSVYGTCRIDLDTWEIDAFYDGNTTPAIPAAFCEISTHSVLHNGLRDGYASMMISKAVCVVDYNTDTVLPYYFQDLSSTYGASAEKNVERDTSVFVDTWTGEELEWQLNIVTTDVWDGKLWVAINAGAGSWNTNDACFGYFDLADTSAPFYFNTVGTMKMDVAGELSWFKSRFFGASINRVLFVTDQLSPYASPLRVFDMATGDLLKTYCDADYPDFPVCGVTDAIAYDSSTIFGATCYDGGVAGDSDKWGLMKIDLDTDQIRYFYPPWETEPGNYFGTLEANPATNELFLRTDTGIAIFNVSSEQWTHMSNEDSEMPPSDGNAWSYNGDIGYYPSADSFVIGDDDNVYLLPRGGVLKQIYYATADSQTTPAFSAFNLLATRTGSADPAIAIDGNDTIYAVWTDENGSVDNLYWDKSGTGFDLGAYLVDETAIEHSMDAPSRLTFTLSHGHLFDPYNYNSLLRPHIAKGKVIQVSMGDEISGTDYWSEQGQYVIKSHKMGYKRGNYPTIVIEAEDIRSYWADHQLTAVSVANRTPEQALDDVITDNTGLDSDDLSIPTMDGSFVFDSQWTDSALSDIIDDICHRFEHFCRVNNEGTVTFTPITTSGTPTRTVSKSKVIEFVPDDTFTDLTNRITVSGESLEDYETVYEEERLTSLNGTVGWYGHNNDITCYYSDDKQLRAHNPRLEVGESASSILFQLAGKIEESITEVDEFDRYCVVTIDSPDLTPFLIAGISMYAAGNAIGDLITSMWGGMTTPVGRYIEGVGLYLVLNTLASVGNYQYEIYGQPIGYVKRSYSGTADDEDLQDEIGFVVEQKYEGFLTHTPAQCQSVADFEMMVTQAQRKRVSVSKTVHYQDEIGDTLTFEHPYTGHEIDVYVTNLKRRYKPGDDGYVIDDLEGWVV